MVKFSSHLRILKFVFAFFTLIVAVKASGTTQPDASADRIILKNSIAYHFVRNVKSIDAEVFITRRISITPLVQGITQLREAKLKLEDFCSQIRGRMTGLRAPNGKTTSKVGKRSYEEFVYFPEIGPVTFNEGTARCNHQQMQLPELYSRTSSERLIQLMTAYNLTNTFAGITFDPISSLQRFIGTGLPWWQGVYNLTYSRGGFPDDISDITDAPHIRFIYTIFDKLVTMYESPSPGLSKNSFNADYRREEKSIALTVAPLICQEKTLADLPTTTFRTGSNPNTFKYFLTGYNATIHPFMNKTKRVKRQTASRGSRIIAEVAAKHAEQRKLASDKLTFATMAPIAKFTSTELNNFRTKRLAVEDTRIELAQEICSSTASYISEIELRSKARLEELLKLVDITIKVNEATDTTKDKRSPASDENFSPNQSDNFNDGASPYRAKRSPLGLFLLKNGVRSVWSLFGFLEKIRTNRRLNKLEKEVGRLSAASSSQAEMVDKISLIVVNHSIIISQLQIATADLSKQVNMLQNRVDNLDSKVEELNTIVHMSQAMTLLNILTERTREAMNNGFEMLEDIISKAVMSETSARLLPVDQIIKVQTDLSVTSNSILDPEYKHMKSVILSDPQNPELLLAIISAVALTRRNQELVRLIPVPWFKGSEAIKPILSHTAVLLDQDAGTFIVLDPDEAQLCARDGHCSTSNPEHRNNAVNCGISQYFNWNLDKCDFENVLSDGTFLKRLGADGIVFSLKEAASSQLFCSGLVGPTRSLEGSGTLQVPAGCALAVTDKNGHTTRIKSLPMSQIIQAQSLDLIIIGPEHLLQADNVGTLSNVSHPFSKLVSEHLQVLGNQLKSTNDEVKHHSNAVIILASVLGFSLLVVILLSLLLYRYSSRFRVKVRQVRTDLEGVAGTLVAFEREAAERVRNKTGEIPPKIPPRRFTTLFQQLDQIDKRKVPNTYLKIGESPTSTKSFGTTSIYNGPKEHPVHYSTAPRPRPRERYLYPMAPLRTELYDMIREDNRKMELDRAMSNSGLRMENSSMPHQL